MSAILKKQEEKDRAHADADSREDRVEDARAGNGLIPVVGNEERQQVNQDRRRGCSFYDKAAALYREVAALSSELSGAPQSELDLSDSPTEFSFMLAYILDIDAEEKQKMLEMRSTSERLQTLLVHLTETINNLEKQIALKKVQTKVRGNGDLGKPGREN